MDIVNVICLLVLVPGLFFGFIGLVQWRLERRGYHHQVTRELTTRTLPRYRVGR